MSLACSTCARRRECQIRPAGALETLAGGPYRGQAAAPMPCGGDYYMRDPHAPLPAAWQRRDPPRLDLPGAVVPAPDAAPAARPRRERGPGDLWRPGWDAVAGRDT